MIKIKINNYVLAPMSEDRFWKRVGLLTHAMLTAEQFEFRVIYFHQLQDLMKKVP